jgi:membrane fusion protein (multidrug efflux system)
MFARINIVYDMHTDALQIPRSAIIDEAGESSVFVVSDDTAHRRSVRTGYVENGRVEILDGLADGETFVLVGQSGLKEGSKVTVINAGEPSERAASNGASASQ